MPTLKVSPPSSAGTSIDIATGSIITPNGDGGIKLLICSMPTANSQRKHNFNLPKYQIIGHLMISAMLPLK